MSADSLHFLYLIMFLEAIGLNVVAAESSCFTAGQIAGVIFVTSFTTLFAVVGVELLLWYFYRNRAIDKNFISTVENGAEKFEKTNCYGRELEMENKAVDAIITATFSDKMTSCSSLAPNCDEGKDVLAKGQKNQSTQRQFLRSKPINHDFESYDSINVLKNVVRCLLEKDTSALGFQIAQRSDAICISHVEPNGPAHRSGNIFVGDKIKELTITFEKMPINDALTILSCASTYKIRLELERTVIQPNCIETANQRNSSELLQPFFPLNKSHSTSELASVLQNAQKFCKTMNGGSFLSKQKYQLPRRAMITNQEKTPSTAFEEPSAKQIPEVTRMVDLVETVEESVIAKESISPLKQCPSSPQSPSTHLKALYSASEIPSNPSSENLPKSNAAASPKVTQHKSQQLISPRISPRSTRAMLSVIPKEGPKIEEVKQLDPSEFAELSCFSDSNEGKNDKPKHCTEFCESIEPRRGSIMIEFEEDQEQDQEEIVNSTKCNGTCIDNSYQFDSNLIDNTSMLEATDDVTAVNTSIAVPLAVSTGDASCPFKDSLNLPAAKGSISQPPGTDDIMNELTENSDGEAFLNFGAETHCSRRTYNSIQALPSAVPNAANKGGNCSTEFNGPMVAESPGVYRKVSNSSSSPASQKSPKRSRLEKIYSHHTKVNEKGNLKLEKSVEDTKEEKICRINTQQRSPKFSPKLHSHIPVVARTPSAKSRNRILKAEQRTLNSSNSPASSRTSDDVFNEEMNGASLYIAKKEALRKTFLPYSKTNKREKVELSKERRARLDANQALLQRQQEELRALGILP